MNSEKNARMRQVKSILCLLLVVLYVVGLVLMLTGTFESGVYLWGLSTLGGILVMGWMRLQEKKAAEAERLERVANGEEDGDETECE